ncbi:unnamed protein product [Rhodiola kirilowii]
MMGRWFCLDWPQQPLWNSNNIIGPPGVSFPESETKMGSLQPVMQAGDGSPAQSNVELSDNLVSDAPKLPGIDDVFWEQFLSTSPLTGETDEISSVLDDGIAQELDITSGGEKANIWISLLNKWGFSPQKLLIEDRMLLLVLGLYMHA